MHVQSLRLIKILFCIFEDLFFGLLILPFIGFWSLHVHNICMCLCTIVFLLTVVCVCVCVHVCL